VILALKLTVIVSFRKLGRKRIHFANKFMAFKKIPSHYQACSFGEQHTEVVYKKNPSLIDFMAR
jgi:hypothetical protein